MKPLIPLRRMTITLGARATVLLALMVSLTGCGTLMHADAPPVAHETLYVVDTVGTAALLVAASPVLVKAELTNKNRRTRQEAGLPVKKAPAPLAYTNHQHHASPANAAPTAPQPDLRMKR